MRLLLTGGGTLGSVTPLLALRQALRPDASCWVGTRRGPERAVVARAGIPYGGIASGKWRRSFDLRNAVDPFFIFFGLLQSLIMLYRFHPTHVIAAGGFVSVPVVFAAWLLGIPSYTIQSDVRPGLANRIMSHFVQVIFCTFEATGRFFPPEKVCMVGAVVRASEKNTGYANALPFVRDTTVPLVLVTGGGTGARSVNELLWSIAPALTDHAEILHITGRGRGDGAPAMLKKLPRYHQVEFLPDLDRLFVSADLVVTRAGMGSLAELALLKKAIIIIPIAASHQEDNARVIADAGGAVYVDETSSGSTVLFNTIRELLVQPERRHALGQALHRTISTDGVAQILTYFAEHQ